MSAEMSRCHNSLGRGAEKQAIYRALVLIGDLGGQAKLNDRLRAGYGLGQMALSENLQFIFKLFNVQFLQAGAIGT
ncbi:MAG: hypothetical protein HRU33_23630 [Rhodobacteraceae bacterium]|nr:hypothetical protein [Paracoccaceae bacterium]